MRPSSKPTGAVWRLLEQWSKDHPLHPNQTQMAGLFGVSSQLLTNWKLCESFMQADDMARVSQLTGIPLTDLAAAVQEDMPRILQRISARRTGQLTPTQQARREADAAGEESQDDGNDDPA